MPAARYWRIVGVSTYGGGELELSELHLYNDAGVAVQNAAVVTSNAPPLVGSLSALADGDTSTFASFNASVSGFFICWDFGAGNQETIAAVCPGSASDKNKFLSSLTLQYSFDGLDWRFSSAIGRYQWPGAFAMTPAPTVVAGDPHFDKVTLLLQFDYLAGATDFKESSIHKRALQAFGDSKPVVSAAQQFNGFNSLFFPNAASQPAFLELPRITVDTIGAGEDFTIEAHFLVPDYNKNRWIIDSNYSLSVWLDYYGNLRFDIPSASLTVRTTNYFGINTPQHLMITRSGGVIRLFLNGIKGAEVNNNAGIPGSAPIIVGATTAKSTGTSFSGSYLGSLRITKGVARQTANFTPPLLPLLGSGVVGGLLFEDEPIKTSLNELLPRIAASAAVPQHSTLSAPRLLTARDMEFAGSSTADYGRQPATGTIYGSAAIAIKGSPNAPVRAKVSLLRARDLLLVRQTWSDPTTGAYAFHGLDPAEKYTTLAEYPTGDYRAVASDQLTPDIEEARAP